MAKKKAPLIEIRQKKGSTGIMTGANTELYMDGKKVRNARAVSFQVEANGVAKVTMEVIGNVIISGKIGKLEKAAASLKTLVQE